MLLNIKIVEWKATFGRRGGWVSGHLVCGGDIWVCSCSSAWVWEGSKWEILCRNMMEHILDPDVLSISTNKIGVSVFHLCCVFFLRFPLSHLLKIFPYATILTCVSKFTCLLVFWKENSDAWITRETMGFLS